MKAVPINTNWNQHYCQDAIVRCIDFRVSREKLVEVLNKALDDQREIEQFDDITGAGASLAVLKEEYWPLICDEITVAVNLHRVRRIFLIDHHDCGAYGGVERFGGNLKAERDFHIEEMHKAKKKLLMFLIDSGTNNAEVHLFYWDERELELME